MNEENILEGFELVEVSDQVENANNILDGFELVEEPEVVSLSEQPKHVSIDKIQGKFEEDDVLKNLNDFYAEDIKNNLISFDTSGGMRDEITVTTSAGKTVIPLNSDFNTTSGFSSLPGREYTKYAEDGSYVDDRESFGQKSYNNLIKTIDSARVKSTPEQKALFKYNDDLGYDAETGTYPDIKAVTQEEVYFPYGTRTSENQEEISSPASTEQLSTMRNAAKTVIKQQLKNLNKNLNEKQTGFDRSTSTKMPGLAMMDPETDFEYLKEQSYLEYVSASKALKIPYTDEKGFTAIWGTVKEEAISELDPKKLFEDYKNKNTDIKSLDTEQKEIRNENWENSLTKKEKVEADFYKKVKKVKSDLKDVNERLKSPSDSTGVKSLVDQKLGFETQLKALTETFNAKYKESASRDINGFWINNRPAISDEERKKLNNVYKNSTTNAENILKNSQRSTLTPQEILEDQTNKATLEKLRTLQVGRDQKVKIRLEDAEIVTGGIGGKIQTSENKVIRSLLQSGKLSVKDIKSGSVTMSYTDLIEAGLHTEDFEGFIDQLGLSFKKGETGKEIVDISLSDGGFMSAKDIKDFKQFERQYYSELMNEQALMDFTYLNKDLAAMKTVYDKEYTGIGVVDHLIGGGGTFIQSAAGAISEMVDGTAQDRQKVEGFLGGLSGTSTRADINAADKIIKDYNNSEYVVKNNMQIKLTDEQKENLDQSLGEAIYSGTGEFVPMVLELAAIDLATGGALGPAGVAKAFPRMGKIFQHILNAGIEEVKMQTLFDMPPTGGAAFYTFGAVTKNMIKLKGPLARWQGVFDKIMVSGVSGMGASEFSKVSEAVYEDLMNEKTFRQSMNEAYGDLDEVQKRMIVSLGNFSMLGIHHLKGVDFMSTKAKYDLMDAIEIKANNINDKAAEKRGEYTTNDKGEKVLNKEFKSIEEKEKYLTESEKSNLNQYSTDFNMLSQYALNESMSNELDPKQVDQATFEKNFNKRYMDPVNRVLKSFDPEYKAPKILFGNSSKNPSFRENFRSGENSTAEITNDGSRMYFDLKYYTPGKALHEITHLGLQTYYKNNPEAKFRMLEKFENMFRDVDVDLFLSGEMGEIKLTGKQTKELVKEGYKERSAEERMEEYLAFMVEGLSNPRAYYQNPRIMSGKLAEMRNYFKDVFKEMGANNIEPPQTAYDLIDLLASMGQSARQGTKIQNKFQTFMSALSDENTSFLNSVNIEAFRMAPERTLPENKYREAASKEMASKDLTKEVEGVEKEKVETMVNKVANRAFTKFYKGIPVNVREKAGLNRKTYLESAKTELQEIAREFDPNKKDKDGNPIAFDRFMANRGMQRMNSLATRLGVESAEKPTSKRLGQERAEGEKEFDIKSEDATPEDALIASEEISSTDIKGITVSKKLGNKADKVVAEIKRKIPVEKKLQDKFLEDKTYKSLKDLAAKETQEMFGIKPKPGNLTKSDVKNAQIFINNNPDLFYGLLPKQHTTKRVNIGTAKDPKYVTRPDKATGVQKVLLEAFYNKGTRKDNLTPWTKKPARDVKTSEFLKLFGITERGNPNLYVKNSNVSARIKALVEQTGRIITNQTVREVIPEARLVGEGRDKTMASIDLTRELKKQVELENKERVTQKQRMTKAFGEIDFYNPESINRAKEIIVEEFAPIFGKDLINRMFQDLTPLGGRLQKYLGKTIAVNDIQAIQTTKKSRDKIVNELTKQYIKEGFTKAKAKIKANKEVQDVINLEQEYLSNNQTLVENDLIIDLSELKSRIEESDLQDNPASKIIMEVFGKGSQGLKNLAKNLTDLKTRKEATKNLIDKFKEAYDANPKAAEVLREFIYNNKASGMLGKNAALMRGKHRNASEKNKYEEHTYPFSSWAIRTMEAIKNKNPKVLEGWKSWAAENYYQTAFSNKDVVSVGDGKFLIYRAAVDRKFNRVDGKGEYDSQSGEHPVLEEALNEAFKTGDFSKVPPSEIRFFNEYVQLNPNMLTLDGKTYAEKYNVTVDKFLENNPAIVKAQSDLIYKQLTDPKFTAKDARETLDEIIKVEGTKEADLAFKNNKASLDLTRVLETNNQMTTEQLVKKAKKVDKALRLGNERNKTIKKARVFDFDDTIARSKSKVFAERDGKIKTLTAEEFAKQGEKLISEGWKMDFTDFNKVVEGKKGPLFDLIKTMKEAKGERDIFILTARAPESQKAIYEFMKAMGVEIPLENITGLGKSSGQAKADWIIDKASEGYNDFFFADDAPQNIKAVQEGMSRLDVKSKTQLVKASKDLKIESERDKKKLNWKTDEAGNIKTTFEVAGKKYNFNLDARDTKGSFDVEFNLGGRIDVTGTGNAVKVVRTVYNGLLDVVSKNPKIKRLEFSSLKSEQSRVKLYTTLMDKVAKKLGWETDVWESNNFIAPEKSSYDFEITKPRKKQVAPVEKVLDVIDVKSETQKSLASKDLSRDFNNLIEESTGIGAEKVFSDVKAQVRGAKAKRQRFFIPPSAEDMLGLVYTTLGKGKKGEAHLKFYQENLFDPYTKAMENLSTDRVNLMADFKALKKQLDVPKDLRKTTESGFTNEQAVRVYLWNKMGEKIPGLSKSDLKELNDIVENNPKLKVFADQILSITKGDGYSKPKDSWAVGTITTDLIDVLNTKKRGKYLETWKQNKDLIYSKENLNKLEAAYGPKYRAALENSLRRMESGSNRLGGGNRLSNQVLDYINNSTGAIMFFNARSAVLQTISAANFINWRFNNPYKAGKAFANQPQYWKDFVELMNSDYLKDRRNGLKLNINESEIANAAKTSGNKAKAALNYILEKGYLPTKYADSFAIASGGATFYRNRINDLIKNEGKTEAEAKEIAMKEFRQVSEMSQQSSDPSKISQQQASDLGRVVLQFANTPMQYARIQKRAVQDIVNGRGDLKANISKIAYYGFLQNMLFNGLQQAVTSLGFGDEEMTDAEEKKLIKAANGMLDSSLRGLGMAGVTIQVLKNLGIDIYDRSKRDRPEYGDSYKKLLDFSPAIKSKLGKFQSAAYPFDSKKRRAEVFEKGFSLDNPAYESMAKVVTGTTNLPLDRLYSKVNNLSAAMDKETETWQSIAMILGWPEWQIKGRKNYVEAPKASKEQTKKDLEKKLGVRFL